MLKAFDDFLVDVTLVVSNAFFTVIAFVGYFSVDGNWGEWQPWSVCNCNNTRTKKRACDNPARVGTGKDCVGLATATEGCVPDLTQKCPGGHLFYIVYMFCVSCCGCLDLQV